MRDALAVISLHVASGVAWTIASLVTAVTGRVARLWSLLQLAAAVVAILAGIDLWHALHAGSWGAREHVLVIGSLCAMAALGMQAPIALTAPGRWTRLQGAPLVAYRIGTGFLVAAVAAMLASRAV